MHKRITPKHTPTPIAAFMPAVRPDDAVDEVVEEPVAIVLEGFTEAVVATAELDVAYIYKSFAFTTHP
jgi:hypothetical protein